MTTRDHTFTLYAAGGRILAENIAGKLVDIGAIEHRDGKFGYQLDVDNVSGAGFSDEKAALQDIEGNVTFLYLDGLFTAQRDVHKDAKLSAKATHQVQISPPDDSPTRVPSGGDTPHIF